MTLLPALAVFLEGLGVSGPFPVGQIVDGNQAEVTLLQHVGSHDEDTTRLLIFPTVQIFIRRSTQAAAHEDAWTAYRALNTLRPITLATGYGVTRSRCPSLPLSLGRDGNGLWRYTLDADLTLHYSAAI